MKALLAAALVGLAVLGGAATESPAQSPPSVASDGGLKMVGIAAPDVVGGWQVVWSANPRDVPFRYALFRNDGLMFLVVEKPDALLTESRLEQLAATLPAARYSFGVPGMMVIQRDGAKLNDVWMITKVVEAPPDDNMRIGDLSYVEMAGGGPKNVHLLRRLPRE